MPGAIGELEVVGVLQLRQALERIDKRYGEKLRGAILAAAEPIRVGAERHAAADIRNVLSPTAEVDWWRMRIGQTASSVYVAPVERGRRGGRKTPKFAGILVKKAMIPARDEGTPFVYAAVTEITDKLISEEGF